MRELEVDALREILDARIAKSQREAFGQANAFHLEAFEALRSVRVLARIDGVMVVEIGLDKSAYARHLSTDLDELAQFVCSCVKTALGHVHDSHNSIRAWSQQALDPERLLVVYPVRVQGKQWKPLFDAEYFTDADLQATYGIPPKNAPSGPPRNALLCLRRAYLSVFEVLLGRLETDRRIQVRWKRWAKYVFFGIAVVVSGLTYQMFYANRPAGWHTTYVALGPQALAFFAYYLAQFWLWDRRRVRLLRSGRTFFAYANPYNLVANLALFGATASAPDNFNDLQTILHTKVDGEVHRSQVHQFWMSLCVGVFGVVATLLAFDQASNTIATQQAQVMQRVQPTPQSERANREEQRAPERRPRPIRTSAAATPASELAWCQQAHTVGGAIIRRCGP